MSKIRELNLVPQHIKNKKANREKINQAIAGGIIICCIIGGFAIYLNMKVLDLEKQKAKLNTELQKTQERFNENQELNLKISDLDGKITKINSLSVLKDRDTKSIVTNLSKKFPKGLDIDTFNFVTTEEDVKNGFLGSITMKGQSKNRSEIEEFWANLREDKRYHISHISGITENEDTESKAKNYSFDIVLKVKEN